MFAANAGDVAAAKACVAATIERFGGLDILVNNAATNPYYGPTLGVDEATVRQDVPGQPARSAVLVPGGVGAGDARQARRDHQHRLGRRAARRGRARRLQPHQGGADPHDPPARRRARADPCGRHRPRAGEDRLRCGPRRQLRRQPGEVDADQVGSASRRTSPTWPRSSPPTWRRGSPARPTSSTAAPASARSTSRTNAAERSSHAGYYRFQSRRHVDDRHGSHGAVLP